MKYSIEKSALTSIADAIRGKYESTDKIALTDFAKAIIEIPSGSGEESNGLFYQEYTSLNTTNLYNNTFDIALDVNDVDWLIMFPLQNNGGSQYAWQGGLYIPDVFGAGNRTSYGQSTFSNIGCASGSNLVVSNGVLTLIFGQNCYVNANIPYGIVGKVKEN